MLGTDGVVGVFVVAFVCLVIGPMLLWLLHTEIMHRAATNQGTGIHGLRTHCPFEVRRLKRATLLVFFGWIVGVITTAPFVAFGEIGWFIGTLVGVALMAIGTMFILQFVAKFKERVGVFVQFSPTT